MGDSASLNSIVTKFFNCWLLIKRFSFILNTMSHEQHHVVKNHSTRFILLSNDGRFSPLRGYYLHIMAKPQLSLPGRAVYIDGRGAEDPISFKWSDDKTSFHAWHTDSPRQKFTIIPIVVNDELVGLGVEWPNKSVIYFGKEAVDFDFEIVDAVLEKKLCNANC